MASRKKTGAHRRRNRLKWGIRVVLLVVWTALGWQGYRLWQGRQQRLDILREIIGRLQADSRVAEVLVTKVEPDPETGQIRTTIKFLEYDVHGRPLPPRYFTFSGNVLQFQSLVIRFKDIYRYNKDDVKGRSAYLFWKVFRLDGRDTEEFLIAEPGEVPRAYRLGDHVRPMEAEIWRNFWTYALDAGAAARDGVKNAQIEAPGTIFLPGYLYTIRIEHNGGLRIEAREIPGILQGETILPGPERKPSS